jgi:hypothetical protein
MVNVVPSSEHVMFVEQLIARAVLCRVRLVPWFFVWTVNGPVIVPEANFNAVRLALPLNSRSRAVMFALSGSPQLQAFVTGS